MQNQKVNVTPNPAGKSAMNRNARRMYEFNLKKYNQAPVAENWADEPDPPQQKPASRGKPTNRSKNYRKDGKPPTSEKKPAVISDPAEVTPQVIKASKEVLRDEPMWLEGPYTGT